MIVFPRKKDKECTIHILIGPESQIDFDLNGSLEMNLSSFLEQYNINPSKENVKVKIINVVNEITAAQRIQEMMRSMEIMERAKNAMQEMKDNYISETINKGNLETGIYVDNVRCPFCHNMGVWIQSGKKVACRSCIEIEDGLEKLFDFKNEIKEKKEKKTKKKKKDNN